MSTLRLAAAAGSAVLCALPVLAEDLTIVYKTTGPGGPGTSTSYFSTEGMRTSDAERDTIIEYGPGRIVSIDHKKKEYSEITLAEMEAAMKQAAAKLEEANKQMESLPPAVRERMQKMMGGTAESVTVTKGGTRQVAGYTCQDYTLSMGEMMTTKLCATTALEFPAPEADFRKFSSFASSAGALANNPMFKGLSKLTDEMKKIEGITLAESTSVKFMGQSSQSSKEAIEVKKGTIPDSAFDVATIAKGYKKVQNPISKMK